ncbi:hypothetical protein AVEN_247008-1 [Araneus ventricosus]|uniref:Uncharacterized protein n=1 Tax=Araneus ventricosus TaxID=182803 RepID=A0A4Y2JAN0_ARAVE|nr:hypothetical protein AVEN_247008-1 [Araneus ventricosus]
MLGKRLANRPPPAMHLELEVLSDKDIAGNPKRTARQSSGDDVQSLSLCFSSLANVPGYTSQSVSALDSSSKSLPHFTKTNLGKKRHAPAMKTALSQTFFPQKKNCSHV